ncbi:hypothetical protein [Micromonospora aurantiaca (nom. illeg.)]|uniref:hypothetical protein n=1 Tax=Micromonospora aurantiaca (nom. illeg.) TaxID=47850 RepID=UPI00343D6792
MTAVALALTATAIAAVAWLWRTTGRPDPTPAPSFDEHAATATALLRPDNPRLPDADAAHIAAAVERAVDAYASYLIAKRDGATADVLHHLTEAMYADLRASLTPPQLARALVIGLHPHADDRARALVDQFRSLPTREF